MVAISHFLDELLSLSFDKTAGFVFLSNYLNLAKEWFSHGRKLNLQSA